MKKRKLVFRDLRGGDIFGLREDIETENEIFDVFIKIEVGFATYHNAIRLKDGWPHLFPEEIDVVKVELT